MSHRQAKRNRKILKYHGVDPKSKEGKLQVRQAAKFYKFKSKDGKNKNRRQGDSQRTGAT